ERENPLRPVQSVADDGWRFGPQSMSAGSLHCDEWTGPAIQLTERDIICIKPVIGWWRTRGTIEECRRTTRYALVVTLSAPEIDIDLHTAVTTLVEQQIA